MQKTYKELKTWQGFVLLGASVVEIFWISGFFGAAVGLYGTLASELLLLGMALLTVLLAKADFGKVFPIKKISFAGVAGTALLWIGSFLSMMIVDLIIMAFFPTEMSSVSTGLNDVFQSVPFQISFFVVAISPAICEEAVFRGVFLHSLKPEKHKWFAIVFTGVLFGACHGSIWRFIPTAFLGIVMGYLLVETDNMIYNGIFHCINNAVPIVLLFLMKGIDAGDTNEVLASGAVWVSVGAYLILGAVIPFSLYIGNYLIHYKNPRYRSTLFPEDKPWMIGVLIGLTILLVFLGVLVSVLAVIMQPDMMNEITKQMRI